MQQRDSFINTLYDAACRDSNIILISIDFGAPALDRFRADLPAQFIHAGISEQNAVNVAVGLALSGKRPYLYAMSPFFMRCYEQLKLAAFHQVPITVVSVGAGLSYAGSGPTHYATEDIAVYRTLVGAEVYTCSTANLAAAVARHTLKSKGMTIVRLERGEMPELYPEFSHSAMDGLMQSGFAINYKEYPTPPHVTYGYLVQRLLAGGVSVMDVFRQKPIPPALGILLKEHDCVTVVEEQYAHGSLGSALIELLHDIGAKTRVIRKCLPERPIYENGKRDELIESLLWK